MGNRAEIVAPTPATEWELYELASCLLGNMLLLLWWCVTLPRLLLCCCASLLLALGEWGESASTVVGMGGGWAKC